jgi:hypothetical protein
MSACRAEDGDRASKAAATFTNEMRGPQAE